MMDYKPPTSGVPAKRPGGGILEAEIGKKRDEWSIRDLITVFRRLRLKLICLMHIGGDGQLRVLDFVPRDDDHLRDILQHGERADGSSIFHKSGTTTFQTCSDIVLRPRLDTAFVEPFSEVPAMAVLCDHYSRSGLLLPMSPSTIVRRAAERFSHETNGCELWSLGEVEYFAGAKASSMLLPHELSHHTWANEGGYHATDALFMELRRKAISILADMGVPVKYAHGEVGLISPSDTTDGMVWEQHEIELALAPLVDAADALILTKWVLLNVAKQLHVMVSFDPMLLRGHAGSGLHQHMSVVRDEVHLPHANPKESMSESTSWLVSGLLQLGGALMLFGNRCNDSFLRLTQGKEAPRAVFWGYFNRKSMIRLPVQATRLTEQGNLVPVTPATVEYRLGDGSAFPHLLLAGIAQAATLGTKTSRNERLNLIVNGAGSDADARAVGATTLFEKETFSPTPVPLTMPEIEAEVHKRQAILCADNVFPEDTMRAMRSALLENDA